MYRDRKRVPRPRSEATSARPVRRANHPVLALQQAVGNRAVGQMLARDAAKVATMRIGKLTVVVDGGNIAEWVSNPSDKLPDALIVTSQKGKHSGELERLSKDRTRHETITLTIAPPNTSKQELSVESLVITIGNGRVKGYALDGKAESWQIVDFDRVNRAKTTPKKPNP